MARVTVVAELGINHGGNPALAEHMIRLAKQAGCDAVKVQSYGVEDTPADHPYKDVLDAAVIWPWLDRLAEFAHKQGLLFGVTPSSLDGVAGAVDAGADYLKNASENLRRHDLIHAMLETELDTWVSTGMGTEDEIDAIPMGTKRMLCTSLYPCPLEEVNLDRLHWGYDGFSDHTIGWRAAMLSVPYGVEMIEKHFTYDKEAEGADHKWSADIHTMDFLVRMVREAEKIMGNGELGFVPAEAGMRAAILA